MSILTRVAIALCTVFGMLAISQPASALQCRIGSFPSVDGWGNNICQRLANGGAAVTQAAPGGCPRGSHPWVDNWGNRVCQSNGGPTAGATYYDTSRGCPVGFMPWADNWGNPVCRRM
jgi:hypothetical protein